MDPIDKRAHPRVNRRIPVRYWKQSDPDTVYAGYTRDVSEGGCYVTTNRAFREGSRIRIEFVTEKGAFVLEGEVRRAISYPRELQRIKTGGMGVRFFTVEELMADVITVVTEDSGTGDPGLSGTQAISILPSEVADNLDESSSSSPPEDPVQPAAQTRSRAWRTDQVAKRPKPREIGVKVLPSFPVRFESAAEYLETFERDLRFGGLFIPTDTPAGLDCSVELVLEIVDMEETIRVRARVVHVHDAGSAAVGIGVQLIDSEALDKLSGIAAEAAEVSHARDSVEAT